MATFYGGDSTASRLQGHYDEAVYFLPQIPGTHLIGLERTQG